MKPILLNEKWRIELDNFSWMLVFCETRTRVKKGSEKEEEYTFEDKWYYPNIKQVLNRFIQEDTKECESIQELSIKLDNIYEAIEKLKNTTFKPDSE